MYEERSGAQLLAEISSYLRYVIEILLVVVAVSLAVNYLSSTLFDALWLNAPCWSQWLQAGVALLVVVGAVGASLAFVVARQVRQVRQIEVVLPVIVSTQHAEIGDLPHYHVTRRMKEALGRAKWEHSEGERRFVQAWREGRSAGGRPVRGFALSCVYDVVECVILDYMGRYGRETLGYQAQFLPGADLAPPVAPPRKVGFGELCGGLAQGNYFCDHDKQFTQRRFSLPAGIELGASPLPQKGLVAEEGERPVRQVWLKGRYGALRITPSQVWQRAPRHRQAGRIVAKHFPEGPNTEVWGVIVQVAVEARFRPWAFFWPPARRELRHHVVWLTGLADYLERRADWKRFIATETDRTLVRLEEKVDQLLAEEGTSEAK